MHPSASIPLQPAAPTVPELLARLAGVPGLSAHALPSPSEKTLTALLAYLGPDEGYATWLAVLLARVYAAPNLPAEAPRLRALVQQASQLLRHRKEAAGARAVQHHLPGLHRALEAVAAALPPAPLSAPTDVSPATSSDIAPAEGTMAQLAAALLAWCSQVHWLLVCYLPDQGTALASVGLAHLPALLRGAALPTLLPIEHLVRDAPERLPVLAELLREALGGPYPAHSRELVLAWAHQAVHHDPPAGLPAFATTLAAAAAAWPVAVFERLVREVVTHEAHWDEAAQHAGWEPVPARRFARQLQRRSVPAALAALGRPTPATAALAALLTLPEPPPAAPPVTHPTLATLFPDPALALAVVQELMYDQQVLRPRFEVHQFAETYEGREIDVDEEGYELIPEALAQLTALAPSPEQLARVQTLNFEFGRPGPEVYFQVMPFDDGTSEELQLRDLTGLAHCPNLRAFYLLNLWPEVQPPSLAPLLELPTLQEAHLSQRLASDPAYQELARRGLLRVYPH